MPHWPGCVPLLPEHSQEGLRGSKTQTKQQLQDDQTSSGLFISKTANSRSCWAQGFHTKQRDHPKSSDPAGRSRDPIETHTVRGGKLRRANPKVCSRKRGCCPKPTALRQSLLGSLLAAELWAAVWSRQHSSKPRRGAAMSLHGAAMSLHGAGAMGTGTAVMGGRRGEATHCCTLMYKTRPAESRLQERPHVPQAHGSREANRGRSEVTKTNTPRARDTSTAPSPPSQDAARCWWK